MISGTVSLAGVPIVVIDVNGNDWEAIIDTGFNGDLELPLDLKSSLRCRYVGHVTSLLAGGQQIGEDAYQVQFPLDGQVMRAEATFVE